MQDLIAYEETLLAGSAPLRSVHADAVRRVRTAVTALRERSSDDDEFEVRLGALCAEMLDEYAGRAGELVSAQDAHRWRELASVLPVDSGYDLLRANELVRAHGAPGAARLLAAVESARGGAEPPSQLDRALAAVARRCVCGYAKNGTMPKRLCQPCARAVGAAWIAEEKSLLQRAAALRSEVESILEEATSAIADARSIGTDDAYSTEEAVLFTTRRKLARANRRQRREASLLDLTRWRELAQLAKRASMPVMSAEARRARRRLGMAQLASLALRGNNDVQARMSSRPRERGSR